MSLDVTLINHDGSVVYTANITHNLNKMAVAADIYKCLWRPDEHGITHAYQIIKPLSEGLEKLVLHRGRFEQYNARNGWGLWIDFVPWCAAYLQACRDYPNALVDVSR